MKYETDKFESRLISEYEQILGPLRYQEITLLEIGVAAGGSLLLFSDYLRNPKSKIIGVDLKRPKQNFPARVKCCELNQNDTSGLQKLATEEGPFDLVIDDGAHQPGETSNCFRALLPHVKVGGYYVIEDWATGYWKNAPNYVGMVEVLTGIVNEAPTLGFEAFKIVLEPGKAIAIFRKGEIGWQG